MESFGLQLITPPASEPVTLTRAKKHCRIDEDLTLEDDLITAFITCAREYAERHTQRQLVTARWRLTMDRFPGRSERGRYGFIGPSDILAGGWSCFERHMIRLPRPPVQSIEAVKYYDPDGVLQTLAANEYHADLTREPARLAPAPGDGAKGWPSAQRRMAAVQIEYTAGYGDAAAVPESIKNAILLMVGHWYENREEVIIGQAMPIPMGACSLLDMHCFGEMR
jgi:hypothetical protein